MSGKTQYLMVEWESALGRKVLICFLDFAIKARTLNQDDGLGAAVE
jgi:hypothetical protein